MNLLKIIPIVSITPRLDDGKLRISTGNVSVKSEVELITRGVLSEPKEIINSTKNYCIFPKKTIIFSHNFKSFSMKSFPRILQILFSVLLISCGDLSNEVDNKLNELKNKTESLDSLINKEVEKVSTLDSIINGESDKVKKLDSIIKKKTSAIDSVIGSGRRWMIQRQ